MTPNGWREVKLSDLLEFRNGVNSEAANYGSGSKFVNIMDIFENRFLTQNRIRGTVSVTPSQEASYALRRGDILFNRTSETFDEIALSSVYLDDKHAIFGGFVIRGRPRDGRLSPEFSCYCFDSDAVRREVIRRGQGAIRANIGQRDLGLVPLLLPPLPEQKKIAEILSAWDGAIETTEKLIANAEKQKRAYLQQLLDSQPWPKERIGDLGSIRSAGVDKKEVAGEQPVRLLNYVDVLRRDHIWAGELSHWVTAPDRQIANCSIRKGDVFFTPSSETRDDIGHSAVAMEDIPDAAYSYHVVRFRPTVPMDLKFRAYAFKSQHFYKQCYTFCEGSGQRYVISQDYFRSFTIGIPPLREQKSIGEILYSCDVMIQKLQREGAALRSEKRALMQQLLTGKRRVNV